METLVEDMRRPVKGFVLELDYELMKHMTGNDTRDFVIVRFGSLYPKGGENLMWKYASKIRDILRSYKREFFPLKPEIRQPALL